MGALYGELTLQKMHFLKIIKTLKAEKNSSDQKTGALEASPQ